MQDYPNGFRAAWKRDDGTYLVTTVGISDEKLANLAKDKLSDITKAFRETSVKDLPELNIVLGLYFDLVRTEIMEAPVDAE